MRISEIHVYRKDLPVVGGPYSMSTMTIHAVETTIVKMVSDTGLTGWGEVAPLGPLYQPQHAAGAHAAIAQIAPALIGQSGLSPLLLRRRMDEQLNGHNYAKAGLEIAAMDLLARHHGIRVCDLLGGAAVERVPAYYATGIGSPEEIAKLAVDKADQGYRRIQIKAGGRDVAIDIAVVHKVWEAVGERVQLVVDPNRGMTTADAKRLCLACAEIPFALEQPCRTLEEVAAIRSQVPQPILLDETVASVADVLRAIALNACDGFGFKITRMGGLGAMATIRDICAARSMPHTCEDSWGGDILAAAIVHLGATVEPRLLEAVWTAGNYIQEHYDPENGIAVDGGCFDVPTGPGLGINPAAERIGELQASYS